MASPEHNSAPQVYFTGSCACSRITYACTQLPTATQACHCVTCRKVSGGPYQAFADVQAASVTYHDHTSDLQFVGLPESDTGGLTILRLSGVAERAFCASCHSALAFRYPHKSRLSGGMGVTMGSIDEESLVSSEVREALRLRAHIFVSQKACWVEVAGDGVEVFERFSGGFEKDLREATGKTL
ncbi:hypothetical protein LTR53_012776 [Teratosphaeriaceae sp. CCFEE 6253]|nr:hypothetical protein LTR53_012776 [Teratosphaeriaceae sp. CCFEE 6253]